MITVRGIVGIEEQRLVTEEAEVILIFRQSLSATLAVIFAHCAQLAILIRKFNPYEKVRYSIMASV